MVANTVFLCSLPPSLFSLASGEFLSPLPSGRPLAMGAVALWAAPYVLPLIVGVGWHRRDRTGLEGLPLPSILS